MSPQYIDDIVEDSDEMEYITEEEEFVAKEQAILAWLWTFPQVSNVIDESSLMKKWANDGVVAR